MINLDKFSPENLDRFQKILKIILDELELQEINRLTGNKISLKRFEKEGFYYDEVKALLNRINKEENIIRIENEYFKKQYNDFRSKHFIFDPLDQTDEDTERWKKSLLKISGISEDDLKNCIILKVLKTENLNKLKEIKDAIDKRLKERAKTYTEETKRQFVEMNEKQKEKELFKKEIIEELKDKKEVKKRRNLITRDKITGNFYYKNKLIKFKNKDAIYYLIFECLYEKEDLNGFCSYETMDKYLVKHGKEKYTDDRQINDRIKNGIMNLFRFSNLPSKAPDGKELVQKVRGKGIILYNS